MGDGGGGSFRSGKGPLAVWDGINNSRCTREEDSWENRGNMVQQLVNAHSPHRLRALGAQLTGRGCAVMIAAALKTRRAPKNAPGPAFPASARDQALRSMSAKDRLGRACAAVQPRRARANLIWDS